MSRAAAVLKRIVVGRPMSHGELAHTLLPKRIALPVFASDALSSMSYATQEVLLVLALAGTAALSSVDTISVAVGALLAIVIVSYRQIVRAYPGGGGAYVVALENLGMYPGLTVAGALLIDYILTVAVSITAGADAIVSAFPAILEHKLTLTLVLIGVVTLANLRGSKESGRLFAVPTYGFVLAMYLLIFTGIFRCLGGCPQADSANLDLEPVATLAPLLLLRAFAAGTTALTGVEAIAEGVPVFRYPQSKNAATTLTILGVLSISMFLGLSWLTDKTNVVYSEHFEHQRTVVAQVADAVFGGGPLFFFVQVMTALILVLAANTAYTGFPVLASILAKDRFMPGQFKNRGDRLVYSNGIVILAVFAALLVYAFDANLTQLIQLYLIGVFLSFTLAQFGTVVRWRSIKTPGWRRSATINSIGGAVTGVVLVVVILTKFGRGAWIVIVAIPVLIALMRGIHNHYASVGAELAHPARRPRERRRGHQHMVIYVGQLDAATARALGVVRSMRPADITAVAPDAATGAAWTRFARDVPLTVLSGAGNIRRQVRTHLLERRSQLGDDDFLTLVVPELLRSRSLLEVFRRPGITRLKASMLTLRGVQLLNVPMVRDEIDPAIDQTIEPGRNHVLVLVSGVHNATLQAIEYAESLHATDIRAVSFGLETAETESLGNLWLEARIPH
ncbi:MAG: APC family permease, partial [Actinomycetota bacterium]|nr:APC family permease [Actinomycetota bacterium]